MGVFLRVGLVLLLVGVLCAVALVADGDVMPRAESSWCRPNSAWCAAPHDMLPAIGAATFGTIGLVFSLVGWFGSANDRLRRSLEATGERATAKVVAVQPTASRIGANPVMRLQVEIPTTALGLVRGRRRVVVPANVVHAAHAGATLPALVDPERADRFTLLVEELRAPEDDAGRADGAVVD